MSNKPHQFALRVSFVYCLLAAAWILCSDLLLTRFVSDPKLLGSISTFKGWAFVGVTSVLLFAVLHTVLKRRDAESLQRTKAEEKLVEQVEQHRIVLELSTDAIFAIQNERISFINAAGARLFGFKKSKELLGRTVFDLIHKDCHAVIREVMQQANEDGKPTPATEKRFLISDESVVDAEVTCTIIQIEGRPAFLVQARDITERKKASQKMRQLSLVVEQSPVSVVITDRQGLIEYVNPKFTEISGYSFEEVLGKNPRILKSGEMASQAYQQLWNTIKGGKTWTGELHNRKKSGELYWEWASISPILDENGRVTDYLAIKEDITERKRALEALRESEERFRILTENAPDLITVVNNEGIIRFQSPSVERVLGYAVEDLVGKSGFEFIHHDDVNPTLAALQRAVSATETPVSAEFRFRHKNGYWHTLQAISKSIPDRTPEGFVVINSRDITENRAMEDQLRQVQKMEALGQLAGGVAHDFNNILAVIQMQVGLLEAAGGLKNTQIDFCREIGKSTQRAANLTRQLLLFSRKQAIQPHDLNLNDVVINITKMLQRILGEDVSLQFNHSPEPLIVHADAGMLDQILVNLAVNSRDSMPKGGKLSIETSVVEFDDLAAVQSKQARPGQFACLKVCDSGCGIPSDILPKIFEPFFTTKDVGKGTGLGLATVFGIVQQHGGWIDVHSEVGHGTTFLIYLPRLSGTVLSAKSSPALAGIRGGNENILLVEDEPALCSLVQRVLTRLGYSVLEASNGAMALQIWKQRREDIRLLLTDLVLPDGFNGRELSRQLLQDKPNLKVIYTSGYSADIAGKGFVLTEGSNFIPKPYEPHKLAKIVRARLDS